MEFASVHPQVLCVDSLSIAQRIILLDYIFHLKNLAEGKTEEQKLIIVTGESGSGKSQLFLQTKHLIEAFKWSHVNFFYAACAHTKASASWLGCNTLNDIFPPLPNKKILSGCRFPYWCASFRRSRQGEVLKQAKVFIIDDFASVGQEKLARMDLQLRTANPMKSSEAFGGKTIILFGTPFSGPRPVLDTSLFEKYNFVDPERSFRHTCENVEESEKYLKFLNRLKNRECTKEDADYVRTRCISQVPLSDVLLFDGALHVFQLKAQADRFNNFALSTLFEHVFKIEQGQHILRFAVGSPVFLTRNICTEEGLYCFARGIVKAIHCEDGLELRHVPESTFMHGSRITYIAVHFPTFTGDFDTVDVNGKKCYKVKRMYTQYTEVDRLGMGVSFTYKFPIMSAYATHRNNLENIEVEKIVLHMGITESCEGTDYLCFTRVDSMEDVLIADDSVSNTRLRVYRLKGDGNAYADEELRLSKIAKFQSESKNITRFLMHRQMGLLNKK